MDNPQQSPKRLDFLAIGDIVTDAFIRVTDATVQDSAGEKKLCLTYGDKIPYEFVEVIPAVGNSANAAVSAARLGLSSALVADIGADTQGKECTDRLMAEKVVSDYVTSHPDMKTNYHYVLWFENDRTILVKHEKYPYALPESLKNAPTGQGPAWIYLSSLGETSLGYHKELEAYLAAHPETKLVFQPGTFQMKFGATALGKIYTRSEIFFCNVEEAERILSIAPQQASTRTEQHAVVKKLITSMHALGPKKVVITDGPAGSYGLEATGPAGAEQVKTWFLKAYPDEKPAYERTGAGDAFASTATAAIIKGKSLAEGMKWGSINSMSVVQEIGAQKGLLGETAILAYLSKSPIGWDVQEI
jgi:ribokinase